MPANAAHRTAVLLEELLKDIQCELYDQTFPGNTVKLQLRRWRLRDLKSTKDQVLADTYVDQEHRFGDLIVFAETRMHHRGPVTTDVGKIEALRERATEEMVEYAEEHLDDAFDGTHSARDIAEKMDQLYKKQIRDAKKKNKSNKKPDDNDGNRGKKRDNDNNGGNDNGKRNRRVVDTTRSVAKVATEVATTTTAVVVVEATATTTIAAVNITRPGRPQ